MPLPESLSPASPDIALVQAIQLVRRVAGRDVCLLHPCDFSIFSGDRVAVTGSSGSGKSVFLRVLALLDPLDGGSILWRGQPVQRAQIPGYRRRVAYVSQRPALVDGSVQDNLRYPFTLNIYRNIAFDRNAAMRLAERAGRGPDFLEKRASELSGGEAQIVALIRILQLGPEVLLLDEPTASLDPESTRQIEALVTAWFESGDPGQAGLSVPRASIWVSHDHAQARRVSNRFLIMRAGILSQERSP